MRQVSQTFLRALTGSHQVIATARVVAPGQTGLDPTGTDLAITGGDVQFDATADVRGNLDLLVDGSRMWPKQAGDLLAPYGNEIWIRRGIDYGPSREWVPLGYFRIQSISQDRPPDGPIRITAQDRMAGLRDARLVTPRQFLAGTTYGTIVSALVTEVYPGPVIVWDAGSGTAIPRSVICDEDRWSFLDELITSLGKIWYWDHQGKLQIRNPPSATKPVWEIARGRGGVLIALRRGLTRTDVYNIVVASGEGADTLSPVVGTAYDDDPRSPTYYKGSFGPVPRFFTSPLISTETQARTAAQTLLRKQLGLPYELDLSAVPNPALEPWDPIQVLHSDREGWEIHVMSQLTIPLTRRHMSAQSREQTTLRIGTS